MILLPYGYKSGKILLAELDPDHYITDKKAVVSKLSGLSWNTPIVPIYSNESLELSDKEHTELTADWKRYQEFLGDSQDPVEKADSYKPTGGMVTAAKRALRWKEEGKAKGAGTPVGWGRATDIASGRAMSLDVVKRMFSFFSRHEVDKQGKDFDNTSEPSNGRIMWDAWGGDAGFTWSRTITEREKKKLEKHLDHDQSKHGRPKGGSKTALAIPESGFISPNNLVSAKFPYIGLSDKAQDVASRISGVKTDQAYDDVVVSQWFFDAPVTTANYTSKSGKEYTLVMRERERERGSAEAVDGVVNVYDKSDPTNSQGHLVYGTLANYAAMDFESPLSTISVIGTRVRGEGIGTAMLEFARSQTPVPLLHSRMLTDEGEEFAATTKQFEKHLAGMHDQSTHGRGGKMGQGVAASILERVKENGGLSVKMIDGSEPTTGFMVAKGAKYGAIASAADFYDPVKGPKILADYMKANKKDLATGKDYLGLWHNKSNGNVYLDVSENVLDLDDAKQRATSRDQISIWDVANFVEIETGGTGDVGKNRGRQFAKFVRNDGQGNRGLRPKGMERVGETPDASNSSRTLESPADITIPIKYRLGKVLLGELTHGMFITKGKIPVYKNSLKSVSELDLLPYWGSEKIELSNGEYNEMTRSYFRTLKRPDQ